jgi:hypothetical protein
MKTKPFFVALGITFLLGVPSVALAVDSYLTAFNGLYKTKNTKLNSCTVCHTSSIPALNAYGKAFKAKHKSAVTPRAALKLINNLDSDKDTFTNLVEIKALTFPGNKKSKPPKSPALAAPADTANSPSVAQVKQPNGASTSMTAQSTFSSTGSTSDFVLEPGYQSVLTGNEEGNNVHHSITVLNETRVVDGVETRAVEERITENGNLVQVVQKYYAISDNTNALYYFGREVDNYENGQIVNHDGSWLAGFEGSRALLMAKP